MWLSDVPPHLRIWILYSRLNPFRDGGSSLNVPGRGTTRFRTLRISLIGAHTKIGPRVTQPHRELVHIPKFTTLRPGGAAGISLQP